MSQQPDSSQINRFGEIKPIKINLGCGPERSHKFGYLNCDNNPAAKYQKYVDVREKLPFQDGEAEVICCENLFDSLTRPEFQKLMREIYRVLCPGGKLLFHCGDVAANPDMCFGWPGFTSPYTRYLWNYYELGNPAHTNWAEYWKLPGFINVEIETNENGIMIGSMEKP